MISGASADADARLSCLQEHGCVARATAFGFGTLRTSGATVACGSARSSSLCGSKLVVDAVATAQRRVLGTGRLRNLRMMKVKIKRYKEERYITRLTRFLHRNGPSPIRVVADEVVKPKAVFSELEFFLSRPEIFKLKTGSSANEVIVSLVEDSNVNEDDAEMWTRVRLVQSVAEVRYAAAELRTHGIIGVHAVTNAENRPSIVFVSTVSGFAEGALPLDTVYAFDVALLFGASPSSTSPTSSSTVQPLARKEAEVFRTELASVLESDTSLKAMCDARKTKSLLKKHLGIQLRNIFDLHAVHGLMLELSEKFSDGKPRMATRRISAASRKGSFNFQKSYVALMQRYGMRERLEGRARGGDRGARGANVFAALSARRIEEAAADDGSDDDEDEEENNERLLSSGFWSTRPISTDMARNGLFHVKYLVFLAYQLMRDVARVAEQHNTWTILRRAQAFRALFDLPSAKFANVERTFDSITSIPIDTWVSLFFEQSTDANGNSVTARYEKISDLNINSSAGLFQTDAQCDEHDRADEADLCAVLRAVDVPQDLCAEICEGAERLCSEKNDGIRENGVESISLDANTGEARVKLASARSRAPLGDRLTLSASDNKVKARARLRDAINKIEAQFGDALSSENGNACFVPGTLHRIVVTRDKSGNVRLVSMQLKRHSAHCARALLDVLSATSRFSNRATSAATSRGGDGGDGRERFESARGASLLVAGPPGSGKTTMLREIARILSSGNQRVVVVDSHGSIVGGATSSVVGHARVVPPSRAQENAQAAMIATATKNAEVDVLVVDEITTAHDVSAVRGAVARGVAVVCGVACDGLAGVVRDGELCSLVGASEQDRGIEAGAEKRVVKRAGRDAKQSSAREEKLAFARMVECCSTNEVVLHWDLKRNVELNRRLGVQEVEQRRLDVDSAEDGAGGLLLKSRFNYDLQRSLEHDAQDLDPQVGAEWAHSLKRCVTPEPSVSYVLFERLAKRREIDDDEQRALEELRGALPGRDFYKEQLQRRQPVAMPSGYNPLRWGEVQGMKPNERPAAILRRLIDANQLDIVLGPRSARLERLKQVGEFDENDETVGPNQMVGGLSLDFPGSERAQAAEKARREAAARPEAANERRAAQYGLDREARILGASEALKAHRGQFDDDEGADLPVSNMGERRHDEDDADDRDHDSDDDDDEESVRRRGVALGDMDAFDVEDMRQRYFDSWAERLALSEDQLREKLELILQQPVDPDVGDPAANDELRPLHADGGIQTGMIARYRTPVPSFVGIDCLSLGEIEGMFAASGESVGARGGVGGRGSGDNDSAVTELDRMLNSWSVQK